jgi:hypothetical protein
MPGTWINRVQHVNDGEAVSGAIDSRPTRALEGNAQYLKDRIDSAELGEGVLAYGETVESAAQVGMAVYRNAVTAQYERALAAVVADPVSGTLVPAASCDVVGIVAFKWNATKADILLAGRQQVDISAAVAGALPDAAPAGRYYLSSQTPGMLVTQKPPVSVSVLVYTDDGYAIVQPLPRDFLEEHIHYRFRLYAQPAGTNSVNVVPGEPGGGNRHVVTNPDPTKLGWLPANHPSFNGLAPTGAAFGYNLATHPQLARVFPPIPQSAAAVFVDRGQDTSGAKLAPMGPGGLCSVDRNGIWWMSDLQGDAPWPTNWAPSVPAVAPGTPDPPWTTSNDPAGPENPRTLDFEIILSYLTMVFTTEKTVVTSLRPAPNSPLIFTNCDGEDATTGDLCADLDLSFLVDPDLVAGYTVFKELDGDTFKQGYVVEGLTQGTNCTLAIAKDALGNPRGVVLPDGTYQGVVQVNAATQAGERELPADLIRLDQTQERYYLEVPYIGFDAGRDTSIRMRFYVPTTGLPGSPTVAVRMQLMGSAGATLPALTLSYRVLHQPQPANPPPASPYPKVPISLPDLSNEKPLAINTSLAVGSYQYTEVQSAAITGVLAGDTILVTLTRSGGGSGGDGYVGEVGVMRPVGILTGT